MKQYLLCVYQPDGDPPPPDELAAIMRDVAALEAEMQAAGVWVFSGGLHAPSTATVVRVRDGEVLTTDGPFAEGKEHVGGFTVVRAPDLDAALEWGRKAARATTLPIEVRPFFGESDAPAGSAGGGGGA
ncbi:MAG TPA: YciI family protein [Chloroflexota bacterium]|nr:YciI family protein [Chloroflexota bacterium]